MVEKVFQLGYVGRWFCEKYYTWKEGGVFRSHTLRKLYKDVMKIDAGIGSYGWTERYFKGPAKIGN